MVIYESPDFLVVEKPAGLQVHPARVAPGKKIVSRSAPTLADLLIEKYPELRSVGDDPAERPGIVHRLDKDTSGIMLIARTQEAFEYLKGLFARGGIEKVYLAVVAGMMPKKRGVIDAPIGIQSGTLKRSVRAAKMAKSAMTEYQVVKTFTREGSDGKPATFSLLRVMPKTGRTHQIRVHLASMGHAVVGDTMYGPKKQPPWATRLMLHALSLEFTAQGGKRMKFEADPPEELSTGLFSCE